MTVVRRGVFLITLCAASIVLAACENTIRGAGEDIKEAGQAVEGAVQ